MDKLVTGIYLRERAIIVPVMYIMKKQLLTTSSFIPRQVIVGTAISYGAKINAKWDVPIIGDIPKG